MREQEYWAKKKDGIAREIKDKFEGYQHWCESTGYFQRIKRCYDSFYSIGEEGTLKLEPSEDNKTIHAKVNNLKAQIKRLRVLITQQKLRYEARAINTDSESQIDADLSRGLLEYYESEKDLGITLSESVLIALVCLECWVWSPWNPKKGRDVRPDEGGDVIREGDQEYYNLTAFGVAKVTDATESPWKIVRVKKHRWTLAAEYPKFKREILEAEGDDDDNRYDWYLDPTQTSNRGFIDQRLNEDESVYLYILYHEKNDAVPEGREVWVCGDAVLKDKPLEYDEVPLYHLKGGAVIESVWSDSPTIDLLSLQHATDLLTSAVITNNIDTAKQSIWSPDPNLKVRKLGERMNLITSAQKPEGVVFTKSAPETYKLIEHLSTTQQNLSGVNEAASGAGASSASGSSIALQLNIALQFISDLQHGYTTLAGNVGSCTINNIKTFAKTSRVAYISGQRRRTYAKRFMADDLMNIDRIVVNMANPMMGSIEGRWELAQSFMQYGVIRDPNILGAFLRTGELDQATEDSFMDAILIRDENQAMLKGEDAQVVLTDNHPQHILKHKELYSDPEVRKDPRVMGTALKHIMDHIQAMKDMPPDLAAILGIPPLPSQQQPPGPPQGPQPMPTTGGPGAEVNPPAGTPPEMAQQTNQMIQGMQGVK